MKSTFQKCFLPLAAIAIAACGRPNTKTSETPPARKYSISISNHFRTCDYSAALGGWTDSLLKNLGYSRSKDTCMEFLQTDIPLTMNGEKVDGAVFVSRDNPRLFFVSQGELLVDFDRRIIGTGGCGGMSRHKTPSGRMWVILVPSKGQSIYGVTLGDDKMDSPAPVFESGPSVSYSYH